MKTDKETTACAESPGYLQMSLAAAMTLGLRPGIFYRGARLCCINLLLTYEKGCVGNCAYCGLQRQRSGNFNEKSFIRVEWPTFDLDEILDKAESYSHRVDRVCISMVTHPRAVADTLAVAGRLRRLDKSVSVLIAPTVIDRQGMLDLEDAGVEIGSVAIDAATEAIFDRYRGKAVKGPHKWETYWQRLAEAVEIFGDKKAGCHLIVGLGETEKEMAGAIQKVNNIGANSHLFSFYPESGSALAGRPACPAGQFRRMQLTSYLIQNQFTSCDRLSFDGNGRLVDFGVDESELGIVIESGIPFMTSGCPGKDKLTACTRPYGDGPPGDIRSYPFMPNLEDIAKIKMEIGD
ncbi:MAG: radical SAM protein [Thermoleophilia bacterium]|nr:radical SAM protein [Thermoleophilia bacterium]